MQTVRFSALATIEQIMLQTYIHQLIKNDVNVSGTSHGLVQTVQFFTLTTFDETFAQDIHSITFCTWM